MSLPIMGAQAGMAAVSAYLSASAQAGMIEAENIRERGLAAANNTNRRGQNILGAAVNSFSRYQQSLNNNTALTAAADQVEAALVNGVRQDQQLVAQSLEASIAQAEQLGVQAAVSAFSGAAGSVVDDVNAATALRYARASKDAAEFKDTALYDVGRRAGAIFAQTAGSLDTGLVFDNVDYGTSIPNIKKGPNALAAAAGAALGSLLNSPGMADAMRAKAPDVPATQAEPRNVLGLTVSPPATFNAYSTTLNYGLGSI
jgi:hypothetical protein